MKCRQFKKKANSLLEKRRDIKLTPISFLSLSLFFFSNPLFYVFSAGKQVTNQFFLCKREKQFGL
jgi:hypothetical protein